MLNLVDLLEVKDRMIKNLSGEQRQRVGLARTLAIKPPNSMLPQTYTEEVFAHPKSDVIARLIRPLTHQVTK